MRVWGISGFSKEKKKGGSDLVLCNMVKLGLVILKF